MAEEGSHSPEKQLLKLIESPNAKEKDSGVSSVRASAVKRRGMSFLSSGAWMGRFSFTKDRVQAWLKNDTAPQLSIRTVNSFLFLCLIGLAAYVISDISLSAAHLKKTFDIRGKAAPGAIPDASQDLGGFAKPASYYLEKVMERDIFKIAKPKAAEEETEEAPVRPPTSRISEVIQQYNLVGISWSKDPDAMIEDTKSLRTYFVKRGEVIGDNIIVRAIFKDKVILSCGGEEAELK